MKHIYLLSFLLLVFGLSAQDNQQYKFRVYLKDKGDAGYSVDEPEKFLSPRAIERKREQKVLVDETDFPLSTDYFTQVSQSGAKVVSHSKWFKTIVVQLKDSTQIENIARLPFVDTVRYVWRGVEKPAGGTVRPRLVSVDCNDKEKSETAFGLTAEQFMLHNAKSMYLSGFTGKGIDIAVIDAGFTNVDVIPYFGVNNIVESKSFIPGGSIYSDSDHGTKVFSTISAIVPYKIMGSAPSANFYLLQSEDASTEFPVEEDYWVRAVEYADSIGVDIINSSLGYSSFDDQLLSYTHDILDGKSSLMSMAADKAFKKGMVVVTSAGNEGSKAWQKISVPGDARFVLTVGAVGVDSLIASFSSKGNTADNRLKPDLVSVGKSAVTIGKDGSIDYTNGTSFSSPFLTGLVASLWSANPGMDRVELLKIVTESGDRFHQPDSIYGHGIPDFGIALRRVLSRLETYDESLTEENFSISRNGADSFSISILQTRFPLKACRVSLLDESGNLVSRHEFESESISVDVASDVLRDNQYIHFLFHFPDTQKTIRFKL